MIQPADEPDHGSIRGMHVTPHNAQQSSLGFGTFSSMADSIFACSGGLSSSLSSVRATACQNKP